VPPLPPVVPPLPVLEELLVLELDRVPLEAPSELELESVDAESLVLDEFELAPPLDDESSVAPPSPDVNESPPQAVLRVNAGTTRTANRALMALPVEQVVCPEQKPGKKCAARSVGFGHQCQGYASK
jgi:hypothetical protein